MELILASGSPRRKEILDKNNIKYTVIKAENDGESDKETVPEIVMELSDNKASEVFEKMPEDFDGIVLGADTVVAVDGEVLGKPADESQSKAMIKRIAGRSHSVFTGVTLIRKHEAYVVKKNFFEETLVYVKPMTDNEIDEYVKTGEGMDKAGSYAIQGIFGKYIDRFEGDYDNVVGLPFEHTKKELEELKFL